MHRTLLRLMVCYCEMKGGISKRNSFNNRKRKNRSCRQDQDLSSKKRIYGLLYAQFEAKTGKNRLSCEDRQKNGVDIH